MIEIKGILSVIAMLRKLRPLEVFPPAVKVAIPSHGSVVARDSEHVERIRRLAKIPASAEARSHLVLNICQLWAIGVYVQSPVRRHFERNGDVSPTESWEIHTY